VALAILGGVIVTALASISYHLTVVDNNINKTLSAMLASQRLEQVRLEGEPKTKIGEFPPPFEDFSWSFKIENSSYHSMKTESMSVSRTGDIGVMIKTMIPEK